MNAPRISGADVSGNGSLARTGRAVPAAGGGIAVGTLHSAGGGAFLKWLGGRTLPGIAAPIAAQEAA